MLNITMMKHNQAERKKEMDRQNYDRRRKMLLEDYNYIVNRRNEAVEKDNGVFKRFCYPVLTSEHIPVFWKYDLKYESNPFLMERLGVNCVFNPGAIELDHKIYLVARVEGYDRKSFFAVAESESGADGFRFHDYPVSMPETDNPDTNVYDMRLTKHEDGWIYGLFCTERKDMTAPKGDLSSAVAACGIARTKDLISWERLDDLITPSLQQRNVVLHPEFVNGKYGLYTRPQDGFIDAGSGGGIGFGLSDSMEHAKIDRELIVDDRQYHTIKEVKNGLGPTPIKTDKGWLHIAHGVRNTAAGLRYVLYAFLSDLKEPWKVTHRPGGFFMAPQGEERIGDVSNVLFCNGMVARENGEVFLYYASSDTRCHVASTTVEKLLDYVINTPSDPLFTHACVEQRSELIKSNLAFMEKEKIVI